MDILSLVGLVLAVCAVLIGAVLKGAGITALLSSAAFMIVVVGTVAAICLQTPLPVMKRAMRILPWVFRPPSVARAELIKKMVEWSNTARKQGLLGLESVIDKESDDFLRKGLQLVVDGSEPDMIRSVLEVDLHVREQSDTRAAKVFEGMGVYSPTLGIIGAVLGLMAVMQNLADPSKLGTRHRRRLRRHHLRHRFREPVLPARRQQAQGRDPEPERSARDGHRRHDLDRTG